MRRHVVHIALLILRSGWLIPDNFSVFFFFFLGSRAADNLFHQIWMCSLGVMLERRWWKKPSSVALWHDDSPGQRVNKEQGLYFNVVVFQIWLRVKVDPDIYLRNRAEKAVKRLTLFQFFQHTPLIHLLQHLHFLNALESNCVTVVDLEMYLQCKCISSAVTWRGQNAGASAVKYESDELD